MPQSKYLAGGAAVAVLGVIAWQLSRGSSVTQLNQPPAQAQAPLDFNVHTSDGHPGVIAPNHSGYTYTPHRYPRACGGEITAVIHRGYGPMRVPRSTPDAGWIVSPPSEVMF